MTHRIHLAPDHPGFGDPAYRRRRDAIAQLAEQYHCGDDLPWAPYTTDEHRVWQTVLGDLEPLHRRWVCDILVDGQRELGLPTDRVPQLAEVSDALMDRTGVQLCPVTGLVPARRFFEQLADDVFLSTQYIRHASRPHYTPEPDVVHELVGHAAALAHPELAALGRQFGRAARLVDAHGLTRIERVYWFTLEFGLCWQGGRLKAVGAGLLSSVGELSRIEHGPQHMPWDLEQMAATSYDTTCYQDRLFVAPSFSRMIADLGAWLDAEVERGCARVAVA